MENQNTESKKVGAMNTSNGSAVLQMQVVEKCILVLMI